MFCDTVVACVGCVSVVCSVARCIVRLRCALCCALRCVYVALCLARWAFCVACVACAVRAVCVRGRARVACVLRVLCCVREQTLFSFPLAYLSLRGFPLAFRLLLFSFPLASR